MKSNFKPLAITAAVAAVTAGAAHAQNLSSTGLGDAAIVPYYTVEGNLNTGIHIINTSKTKVTAVKLRMRRGSDSMDALDFNIILSPNDEWTGGISLNADGNVQIGTGDTSCTAPQSVADTGKAVMPSTGFPDGANEGYIEVIGMGSIDQSVAATNPAWADAVHKTTPDADGKYRPANCARLEGNFDRNATTGPNAGPGYSSTAIGVVTNDTTHQIDPNDPAKKAVTPNTWSAVEDELMVSWFISDTEKGLELGNQAVMLSGFTTEAWMTNQRPLVRDTPPAIGFVQDVYNFTYPDLNGGPSDGVATRGLFDSLRLVTSLGAAGVTNDWSVNPANSVGTDWVMTLPGQYTMIDLEAWVDGITKGTVDPMDPSVTAKQAWDNRDLPVVLETRYYDREEQFYVDPAAPDGGLVISPAVETPIVPGVDQLETEVTVIQWTDGADTTEPVLGSQSYAKNYNIGDSGFAVGWAAMNITSRGVINPAKPPAVRNYAPVLLDPNDPAAFTAVTNNAVPLVGFAAWERQYGSDDADAPSNYGRAIEHAYGS
ncbi:MAG: hypothetical protein ABJ084_15585 [Halioglobus sp.]